MRAILSLVAVLTLTACFDAEMVLDFKDRENVETTVTTELARALYDMSSLSDQDPCENGIGTLTEESFTCVQSATMTIDEAIARPNPFNESEEFDPSEGMTLTRIDDNTMRVSVKLDELNNPDNTPEQLDGMGDMAAAAFAGHSIIFRVRGYKILDTTGTLSEDGREASLVVPITGLLTGNTGLPPAFETTVQLEKSCAFLGLFCD
ncbi:hypothetical protein [Sinisalibacter aestuarii]|uniref:Lipoprotein n=1 Tax=Sinisalibacter aestuarii TaxID=2949426 RepID=A0ABQ5LMT3_9RHOB|nr:hypothetical protein [Sinisalibacter aestuarii]GKY86259.1 hypothetical protein STA1M1_01280 [Sinisalibacter aestuarii]